MDLKSLTLNVANIVVEAYEKGIFTSDEVDILFEALTPVDYTDFDLYIESDDSEEQKKIPLRKKIKALVATVGTLKQDWKTDREIMQKSSDKINKENYKLQKEYEKELNRINKENKKDLERLERFAKDSNHSHQEIQDQYYSFLNRKDERDYQAKELQKRIQDKVLESRKNIKQDTINNLREQEKKDSRNTTGKMLKIFNKDPKLVNLGLNTSELNERLIDKKYDKASERNQKRYS